jgi:RNA polymerase sigma factor (sigma-70 family)
MSRLVALFARSPADPRTDRALLAAFLSERDEPAFAELVRRHGPLVWATCRRALPDPADAEDAFQATFLVLVRRADRLTAADSLGPWLYRVAAWTGRSQRRKNARRRALLGPLRAAVVDPCSSNSAVEIDDLLLALPDRYRSALVLCHLQGLTHREAADQLGCAEGTVSSLVSRALAKLRAKLGGRDLAALLAPGAAAAVPADLAAEIVRSAAAFQLTTLSAAASPTVARLTEGVLRMFWVKKTVTFATMVLVAALGIGVSMHEGGRAVGDEPKPPAEKSAEPKGEPPGRVDLRNLEARLLQAEAEHQRLLAERKMLTDQIAALKKAAIERSRLRIAIMDGEGHPITVSEQQADGQALWSVVFAPPPPGDFAVLRTYLTRARQDKDGPRVLTIACHPDVKNAVLQSVVKAAREAGFDGVTAEVIWTETPVDRIGETRQPTPTRTRSVGGDGPPGGEFHEDVAVGETFRIAIFGGRLPEPVPAPSDLFRLTADAEGLIVTGLKPGVARVTVRDTKGRDHTIRIEVKTVAKP